MNTIPSKRLPLKCNQPLEAEQVRKHARLFLRGPVPMTWLGTAGKLPGHALHIAVLLHFRSGCDQSDTVTLRPEHRRMFGLSRHTAHRALRSLERAGLVQVTRRSGAAPIVTINRNVPAVEVLEPKP